MKPAIEAVLAACAIAGGAAKAGAQDVAPSVADSLGAALPDLSVPVWAFAGALVCLGYLSRRSDP